MSEQDESYLDALLESMTASEGENTEEMPEAILEDLSPEEEEPFVLTEPEEPDTPEELELPEEAGEPEEAEEPVLMPEEPDREEAPEVPNDFPVDIISDENGEDLSELLGMLAEHYDEEQESQKEITRNIDDSAKGMDDVFEDTLSAVSYMENEEELAAGLMEDAAAEEEKAEPAPKKEKKSFRERFFNNIVEEKDAERELAEKEAEIAAEEKKEAKAEEKKKNKQADKEEKVRLKQENKEKQEAQKAAKQAEKQQKKEDKERKKQLRLEEEANEVIGRINPIGAVIVFAFFGVIAIAVIFGTKAISYTGSVHDAEIYMDTGNYEKAYTLVSGLNLSESDQDLYEKVRMCAQLRQQIKGCDTYIAMGKMTEALDCLIKGIKQYDENADLAEKYQIVDKQQALLEELSSKLQKEFQMTTAEARQILQSDTREQYTKRLQEKAAETAIQ